MTTRRELLIAIGASALAALPALAQQEKRMRRIGYFSGSSAQGNAARLAAFRAGMSELRWIERRDYLIDARYANGIAQAGPGVAAELVANEPDLLLAAGDESVLLLTQKTKTIPIVFTIAQDPVGSGLASSLQRPGGSATGLTTLAQDLGAKRLQLIKEAFPHVSRVVLLFEPDNRSNVSQVKVIEAAAARLGMRITSIGLRQAMDIEGAVKRGAALGTQAYMVTQSGFITSQRQAIVEILSRSKIPVMFSSGDFVEAGGLMSYGASPEDNYRRSSAYVDKILKGAKPGDLPIEQPSKFELMVNMKIAKVLGLTISPEIMVRADKVIE